MGMEVEGMGTVRGMDRCDRCKWSPLSGISRIFAFSPSCRKQLDEAGAMPMCYVQQSSGRVKREGLSASQQQ